MGPPLFQRPASLGIGLAKTLRSPFCTNIVLFLFFFPHRIYIYFCTFSSPPSYPQNYSMHIISSSLPFRNSEPGPHYCYMQKSHHVPTSIETHLSKRRDRTSKHHGVAVLQQFLHHLGRSVPYSWYHRVSTLRVKEIVNPSGTGDGKKSMKKTNVQ